ncbi:hypothetical protein DVH24_035557, partial [Malus domestica]
NIVIEREITLDRILHTQFDRKKVLNQTIGRQKCYNCYDWIEHETCEKLNAGISTQLLQTLFKVKGVVYYGIAGNADPQLEIGNVTVPQFWAHTGLWNWQLDFLAMASFVYLHNDVSLHIPTSSDVKPKVRMGTKNPCQNLAFVQSGPDGTWNPYHQVCHQIGKIISVTKCNECYKLLSFAICLHCGIALSRTSICCTSEGQNMCKLQLASISSVSYGNKPSTYFCL